MTQEQQQQLEHEQVRRERTGERPAPRSAHPVHDPHAPLSAYADPRPRPSIAYDPSTDAELEISVEEIVDDATAS
jgi:hypothetical protein